MSKIELLHAWLHEVGARIVFQEQAGLMGQSLTVVWFEIKGEPVLMAFRDWQDTMEGDPEIGVFVPLEHQLAGLKTTLARLSKRLGVRPLCLEDDNHPNSSKYSDSNLNN